MISNTSLSAFSAATAGASAASSGIAPARLRPIDIAATNTASAAPGKIPPARPDITTTTPRPNLPRGSLLDLSI